MDYDDCERRFSSMSDLGNWPQAKKHHQWPDNGKRGSKFSDQFMMSQLNTMEDRIEIEEMSRVALKELLSIAGKSCVLGHSQGGPFCWLAGDVAPSNIQALIAVEPNGPPFYNVVYGDHPQTHIKNNNFTKLSTDKEWYKTSSKMDRPGGITYSPLTFDPPLKPGEQIKYKIDEKNYGDEYVNCFLQDGDVKKLKNLSGLPILILSAEASYHAPYDHGTSNFLTQSGVKNSFIRLQDHGICGNGHMMMLEKNNHQIADFILKWLEKEANF
jgi:pimeloyl-ACP methyl ester carboxylesterase